MPKYVKINVEDHRLIDNKKVVEDVTQVVLPTFEHPTTSIQNVSGMVMDIDMPNTTRLNAAEFSVAHNNGANCDKLQSPDKHVMEFRTVRQKYVTSGATIKHESVKYLLTGQHKSTEKGTIETGNPWGSTEKYALIRYEEIVDGKQTMLVDIAGTYKVNGKDYASDVQSLLN